MADSGQVFLAFRQPCIGCCIGEDGGTLKSQREPVSCFCGMVAGPCMISRNEPSRCPELCVSLRVRYVDIYP